MRRISLKYIDITTIHTIDYKFRNAFKLKYYDIGRGARPLVIHKYPNPENYKYNYVHNTILNWQRFL